MPAELSPPELARLVAFADRPRADDWSLRAALCRYAQPEPGRVRDVAELVRRIEFALPAHQARLAADGELLWALHEAGAGGRGADAPVVALLDAMGRLDELAERLAAWAVDRGAPRPDAEVDEVVAELRRALDAAGIPVDDRVPPPGVRRRG